MWNSRKVAEWIEAKSGKKATSKKQRGWDYLKRLGHSSKVPRPRHASADKHEQEAFKKGSPREVGAGKRKRILLVLDGTGWHTTKKLKVPERIHLEFLPSHSPELQPSERLWPLSDEAVANRHFEPIEDLEEALVGRCVALRDQPEVIRSYIR